MPPGKQLKYLMVKFNFFMNEGFPFGSRSSLLWLTMKVFPMKDHGCLNRKGTEHCFWSPSIFLDHKN